MTKTSATPKLKIKNRDADIKPACLKCSTLNPNASLSYKCAVRGSCPALPPVAAPVPAKKTNSVAAQVRGLEVGDSVVVETSNIVKTQAAVTAAASKVDYKVEQRGFYAVSSRDGVETASFIRVKRTD